MWYSNLAGKSLGDYRLVNVIGAGGFGVVFAAEVRPVGHGSVRRKVAVKIIDPNNLQVPATNLRKLPAEIELGLKLRHQNLLPVEKAGFSEIPDGNGQVRGVYWYAMEIAQFSLAGRLQMTGPVATPDLLHLAVGIGSALMFLHGQRPLAIVHRDVKPANILFARNEWRLGDLGLARRETPDVSHTTPAGTVLYLPPEAYSHSVPTPAWDVWAFGLTISEATVGPHPFAAAAANRGDLLRMILDDAPIKLPRMAEPFGEIVRACLEKNPKRRPDMSAVLERLNKEAVRPREHVPNGKPRMANPSLSPFRELMGAVTVLAAIAGFSTWLRASDRTPTLAASNQTPTLPANNRAFSQEPVIIAVYGNWEVLSIKSDTATTCLVRTFATDGRAVALGWSGVGAMYIELYSSAWNFSGRMPVRVDIDIDGSAMTISGTGTGRQVRAGIPPSSAGTFAQRFAAGRRMTIITDLIGSQSLSVSLIASSDAYAESRNCLARNTPVQR